ncbi:MAG: thiaminase II [Ktedonobacteraceae bacterium]|nr:thiaminase II [Ktedonobacteraceae bacterium]MBO0789442.1 thiaminase II [Ktedonobacteraceae bacterium]
MSGEPQDSRERGLSERLRASVLPLWQRQFQHPFVLALGDGSLPSANFEFYIRQDALFLDVLAKTFACAIGKTSDHAEMEQFGKYILDTLLVEADIHRRYGERLGLTAAQMAATPMAPTNYAYTSHLLRIATTEPLPALLTAVLPCAWLYAEIGQHFAASGPPPESHPYADWLATYASPDFAAVALWLRTRLDASHLVPGFREETRLLEIFRISTIYEWSFWDMAWKLEEWLT